MSQLRPADAARQRLRETVICRCAAGARREAQRYSKAGEPLDDLVQVATLGLILAVDRFDPGRGVPFRHFAVPTIVGELKRHFRDKSWTVRVNRRVQELCQELRRAEPALAQRLGHLPSVGELAEHLGVSSGDVEAARTGAAARTAHSLNRPASDEDQTELGERIASIDHDLELIPDRDALQRAWPMLPLRLREILTLRYVDDLSQRQIADKIGISQMHVSRLITRAVGMLRRQMTA